MKTYYKSFLAWIRHLGYSSNKHMIFTEKYAKCETIPLLITTFFMNENWIISYSDFTHHIPFIPNKFETLWEIFDHFLATKILKEYLILFHDHFVTGKKAYKLV